MGAIAFLVLFLLGVLIATAGSIVGIVDAFRVSPVWGLLALLVPFALLVYCIKFWNRKWARNSLIMGLGGLGAMLLSLPLLGAFMAQRGLQFGDSDEEVPSAEVPVESVPIPEEMPVDGEAPGEVFAEPLVPVAPQLSPIARADLIQSTDPNERLQQINNSRPDPFAVVPIPPPPVVVAPPPAVPGGGSPTAGGTGGGPGGTGVPGGPGGAPGGAGTPVAVGPGGAAPGTTPGAGSPGQPTTPPPLAPLPQLPQPTLAEAVLVSGVMTIGNENFAVVQTTSGSQYVRAGQRVSNGQVLVKRIDMRGREPVVILEENGIEVSRPVGGTPVAAEQPPA